MTRQIVNVRSEASKGTLEEGTLAFAKLAGRDAGSAGATGSPRVAQAAPSCFRSS